VCPGGPSVDRGHIRVAIGRIRRHVLLKSTETRLVPGIGAM
jgi:hypothetical protein